MGIAFQEISSECCEKGRQSFDFVGFVQKDQLQSCVTRYFLG